MHVGPVVSIRLQIEISRSVVRILPWPNMNFLVKEMNPEAPLNQGVNCYPDRMVIDRLHKFDIPGDTACWLHTNQSKMVSKGRPEP